MSRQSTLNWCRRGPDLLNKRNQGPALGPAIGSGKVYSKERSHKIQKPKAEVRRLELLELETDSEEEEARDADGQRRKTKLIDMDDEDDISEEEVERTVKRFKRTKGPSGRNMFDQAISKTDKFGVPQDNFGDSLKLTNITSKDKITSPNLDLKLSKEEQAAMKDNSALISKLNSLPKDSFESLEVGGTPKSIKNADKLKKALTEDESKTEDNGSKYSKLLMGLKENSETENFAQALMRNKVKKQEDTRERSFVKIDLDEEIDSGFRNGFEEFDEEKNFKKQRKIVEKKYRGKSYPGALDKRELEAKAKKHLRCIPKILNGKITSPYYGHASDIAKRSSTTVLSSAEFLRLPISEFTIGFYGVKRQAIIASLIKNEFDDELNQALLTNKTLKFWSVDSFVLYVLACDVAVRMAACELDISTGEAFDVLFDTVDYGKYITDPIPL